MKANGWQRGMRTVFAGVIWTAWMGTVSCGGGAGESGAAADGEVLRFRKLAVHDPAAGVTAFTMLIPGGWQTEGGIVWRPHLSNQAAASMRVWNPEGSQVLELLPCDPFTWHQGGVMFHQPGSIYLGNEVRPPITDPAEYVLTVAIPRYREEIANPTVVDTTPLPQVAAATAQARAEPGVRKTGHAARVRVAYTTAEGRAMHEDFICVLLVSVPMTMPGMALWGPDNLYSFRAEAGTLEASEPLLQAMASSVRITPQWFNILSQVQQMWVNNQMQAIRNAGRISRIISQTHNEISDMIMQAYENRQASQDRISREFSESIRGVETYRNPYQTAPVELPSGYDQAWVSAGGEYILSNDTGFDPNRHDTVEWQRMNAVP